MSLREINYSLWYGDANPICTKTKIPYNHLNKCCEFVYSVGSLPVVITKHLSLGHFYIKRARHDFGDCNVQAPWSWHLGKFHRAVTTWQRSRNRNSHVQKRFRKLCFPWYFWTRYIFVIKNIKYRVGKMAQWLNTLQLCVFLGGWVNIFMGDRLCCPK